MKSSHPSNQKSPAFCRTDNTIIQAFLDLAKEIPFEKLTVQNILDKAQVSRYTFYAHFKDKYEIAEQLQEELWEEFETFFLTTIPEMDAQKSDSDPLIQHFALFDRAIFEISQKNFEKYSAIKNIHTESVDITRKLQEYMIDHYKKICDNRPNAELESQLLAANKMATINYYADHYEQLRNTAPLQDLIDANIYSMLDSIGIHNEADSQNAYHYLMDIIDHSLN